MLAASIGESTGQLALCLRNSIRRQLAPVWLEILPRIFYPLFVLLFVISVVGFWMVFIGPKIQKIFADFHQELPALTALIIAGWSHLKDYALVLIASAAGILLLGSILLLSSTARWYVPGISRFYRLEMRSRVLQMLGVLLETGKPIPMALGLLIDAGYFRGTVCRRLEQTRRNVEQGEPRAASCATGALDTCLMPLFQAAERARTLPWALTEMGAALAQRTVRLMRRVSQVLAPLTVVAIGILVGFLVVGMFLPLIKLIWSMSV